jgi:hypothetical protein
MQKEIDVLKEGNATEEAIAVKKKELKTISYTYRFYHPS